MKKLLLFLFLLPLCGFAQLSDATLLLHDSTQIKQLGTSQLRSWQMFKEVIQSKVNVSNGITTSGLTTGYIPYATSATTLGNSELSRITANLYGLIGITNSAERFSIVNSSSGSNAFSTLLLSSDGTPSSITQYGVNGLAPNRLDIGNAGGEITLTTPIGSFVGINITPSRELHVALMDATTNSVGIVQRLTKLSSGTAAIGIGSGLELGAVNSVGLQKVGSSIESPFTSVANTNESADFVIKNISTGTLTERLRVTSAGAIGLSGANYGTSGQVLTSGGPGAAVTWGAASGGNPFADNAALVKNSSDATKLLILSAASITTGTTRTWTFPDVNGTVARNDASQNFSGIQSFLGPASFYGVGPNGPQLTTGTYRGTFLSPTTIISGDALANIQFDGYDGTSYTIGAQILAVSTGTIATGKIGTRLTFLTSTTGGSLNTALTITESQVVTFAQLPTIPVTPVASTDAASKGYVDGLTTGPFSTVAAGYTNLSGGANNLLIGNNTWTTALPNGITATTQAVNDNSTKVATTAYVNTSTLTPTTVKIANYTASVFDFVPCDVTTRSFTVTLPTTPADNSTIGVKIVKTLSTNNTVIVATGGSDVFNVTGGVTTVTMTRIAQTLTFKYKSSSGIWYVASADKNSKSDLDYYPSLSATLLTSTMWTFGKDRVMFDQVGPWVFSYGGYATSQSPATSSEVWRANVSNLASWTKLTDAPWAARSTVGHGVIGNDIVLWGADIYANNGTGNIDSWKGTVTIATGAIAWTRTNAILPFSPYIYLSGDVVQRDTLYRICGQNDDQIPKGYTDSVFYSPDKGVTWAKIAGPVPGVLGRNLVSNVVSFNGKIVLTGGGQSPTNDLSRIIYDSTIYFSRTGKTWTKAATTMQRGQEHPVAAVMGDKAYFLFGNTHLNPQGVSDILYMDSTYATHKIYTTISARTGAGGCTVTLADGTQAILAGGGQVAGVSNRELYLFRSVSDKKIVTGDIARLRQLVIDDTLKADLIRPIATPNVLDLNKLLYLGAVNSQAYNGFGFGTGIVNGNKLNQTTKFDYLGVHLKWGATAGSGGGNAFENNVRTASTTKYAILNFADYNNANDLNGMISYSTSSTKELYFGGDVGFGTLSYYTAMYFALTSGNYSMKLQPTVATHFTPVTITPTALASAWIPALNVTPGANTGITASTAKPNVLIAPSTQQWATGALSGQANFEVGAETLAFVGASTATEPTTLLLHAPVAGTNANAFVRPSALTLDGHLFFKTGGTVFGIIGTTTNDAAVAGNVGEEIPAIQSTYTNYTTTATYQNITSITLTAGDWDISAFGSISANGATVTTSSNAIFVISTTTASAAGAVEGKNIHYVDENFLGSSIQSMAISPYRVSISGSTTYYLNSQATFTLGNPQFVGSIRARRIR